MSTSDEMSDEELIAYLAEKDPDRYQAMIQSVFEPVLEQIQEQKTEALTESTND